jgi:hypothetical protein
MGREMLSFLSFHLNFLLLLWLESLTIIMVHLLWFLIFKKVAGHWWSTPVILATQEAKIRRIVFRSQGGQIVRKTLSQKDPIHKKDWRTDSSGKVPA